MCLIALARRSADESNDETRVELLMTQGLQLGVLASARQAVRMLTSAWAGYQAIPGVRHASAAARALCRDVVTGVGPSPSQPSVGLVGMREAS